MNGDQGGFIKETGDQIVYEIPKSQTNIMDVEQLDELNRKDDLFFNCQRYAVEEDIVRIYYQKPQGYKALSHFTTNNHEMKCKIAMQILEVEKIVGTQYTTRIHPDNIYVNEQGDVRFAQRGIRFVLTTDELTKQQVVEEVKPVIIGLFNGRRYEEVHSNIDKWAQDQPFMKAIQQAATIKQLRTIISQPQTADNPSKSDNSSKEKLQKFFKPKILVPTGLVLGMVAGMLLLYAIKVVPMSEATTTAANQQQQQQEELIKEKEALEAEIANNGKIIEGYHFAATGEVEEAIASFESMEQLDEEAQQTLIDQYIKLGTVDSLTKASQMDPSSHIRVVNELRSIEGEEAQQAILDIESDAPEVEIEQAWINKDFDRIIDIYGTISDNDRAKYLAARSYLEKNNHKEAMKLGKELNNKNLQVDSLELQKKEVQSKKMKKDKKEDEIKKIDKQIKKIKDS
ncbi:type VII secretion protein EssB/YukC [Gracilibacillus alcaliphilus]|uniref:type VII secretion protein EssB/YukC n=1 Tax=Gracilibacillus alcaliphilus TaxID=1401441 RepID=UPI00195A43DA|nr:type VII secretion protein EssB/YukC [Gracilibacillus alcaliphilus]MBM7676562.1 putative membrane protein YukC [Gracilibacillus alcaliphilus]